MEDLKAYIESGVLELYVLGDISQEEKLQVESMALQHPVIKAELVEIEKSIEKYAEVYAIAPSDDLRDRVLNSLVTNLSDDRNFNTHPASVPQAKVVSITPQKSTGFYKYAFAACLALLVLSVAALFSVYNRLQNTQGQLVAMQQQTMRFSSTAKFLEKEIDVYRDHSFHIIKLGAGPAGPKSALAVAWSPSKKTVMLDMSQAQNMPVNDEQHSYQLWAMVDGKPVDLGVFDVTDKSTDMVEMKSIDKAQAFAVTLEPKGGLPSPTLSNLMVIGKTDGE